MDKLAVRCRMVIPENCARLPAHMSLTAKLLASPRALTRIQLYCKNRPGYIVPGTLGGEEVSAPTRLCLFDLHIKQSSCRPEFSIPDAIHGEEVAMHSCCYPGEGLTMHYMVHNASLACWDSARRVFGCGAKEPQPVSLRLFAFMFQLNLSAANYPACRQHWQR